MFMEKYIIYNNDIAVPISRDFLKSKYYEYGGIAITDQQFYSIFGGIASKQQIKRTKRNAYYVTLKYQEIYEKKHEIDNTENMIEETIPELYLDSENEEYIPEKRKDSNVSSFNENLSLLDNLINSESEENMNVDSLINVDNIFTKESDSHIMNTSEVTVERKCIGLNNSSLIEFARNYYGLEIWIGGELRAKYNSNNYFACEKEQIQISKQKTKEKCNDCFKLAQHLYKVKRKWTKKPSYFEVETLT